MKRRFLGSDSIRWIMVGVWVVFAASAAVAQPKPQLDLDEINPMIFIHGSQGSAAQFESQAKRFTSNGYPQSYLTVVEYDSPSLGDILPDVLAAIDARIAELQALTGREQVDLLGHSLGTFVSRAYLATPERAAKVAHYVNIDGGAADELPGGVPTLALWAGAARDVQPVFGGAINVTIPNQEHVEVATSAESFFEIFHFFTGEAPATTDIVAEPPGQVRVSGRALLFPENVGVDGATLEIWLIHERTGERRSNHPKAVFAIGPDGHFGPFKAKGGKYYEFALLREGEVDILYYYEPFLRSDHLVRVNLGLGLVPFIDSSDDHSSVTVLRNKEFWGDRGAENDVLSIGGVNVINETTAPSGFVGAAVAMFAFDDGSDGVSDVNSIPFPFGFLGFLTAADLFIPADPPGTVSVVTVPRGDASASRTVNVRNTPSTEARIVVQLDDFEQ